MKARFATKADVIVPEKLEALLAKLRAKADADEMNSRPVCSLSPQVRLRLVWSFSFENSL